MLCDGVAVRLLATPRSAQILQAAGDRLLQDARVKGWAVDENDFVNYDKVQNRDLGPRHGGDDVKTTLSNDAPPHSPVHYCRILAHAPLEERHSSDSSSVVWNLAVLVRYTPEAEAFFAHVDMSTQHGHMGTAAGVRVRSITVGVHQNQCVPLAASSASDAGADWERVVVGTVGTVGKDDIRQGAATECLARSQAMSNLLGAHAPRLQLLGATVKGAEARGFAEEFLDTGGSAETLRSLWDGSGDSALDSGMGWRSTHGGRGTWPPQPVARAIRDLFHPGGILAALARSTCTRSRYDFHRDLAGHVAADARDRQLPAALASQTAQLQMWLGARAAWQSAAHGVHHSTRRATLVCVQHNNLNCDNVWMEAGDGHVVLTNLRSSGFGPILSDSAQLMSEMLVTLMQLDSAKDLQDACCLCDMLFPDPAASATEPVASCVPARSSSGRWGHGCGHRRPCNVHALPAVDFSRLHQRCTKRCGRTVLQLWSTVGPLVAACGGTGDDFHPLDMHLHLLRHTVRMHSGGSAGADLWRDKLVVHLSGLLLRSIRTWCKATPA